LYFPVRLKSLRNAKSSPLKGGVVVQFEIALLRFSNYYCFYYQLDLLWRRFKTAEFSPIGPKMPLKERQAIMQRIEKVRKGRILICFFNFDRESNLPLPGVQMTFAPDAKEVLYRVLKESHSPSRGIDLCLYTRGGDTNAVWPIVTLLREFDPDFNVLVPFRCHSAGTLLAIGAKRVIMAPIGELSPIDPTTGNQFNPQDVRNPQNSLGISVEDVQQYKSFVASQLGEDSSLDDDEKTIDKETAARFLMRLAELVHPLALGNVHRVHRQIQLLAKKLLKLHAPPKQEFHDTVKSLTTRFYSHLHMVSRVEAQEILGDKKVQFADQKLSILLDDLLRRYEDDFELRKMFVIAACLGPDVTKSVRLISGAIESTAYSYLYETLANLGQNSILPANVQVQIPTGQNMPLIPGVPRQYTMDITSRAWVHNKDPKGVTK
jgi:ATP-dependent protease ClpP protease subunit